MGQEQQDQRQVAFHRANLKPWRALIGVTSRYHSLTLFLSVDGGLPALTSGHPGRGLTVHPYFFAARTLAHLALWAAAILFLPAADILRRGAVARLTFVFAPPPSSRST